MIADANQRHRESSSTPMNRWAGLPWARKFPLSQPGLRINASSGTPKRERASRMDRMTRGEVKNWVNVVRLAPPYSSGVSSDLSSSPTARQPSLKRPVTGSRKIRKANGPKPENLSRIRRSSGGDGQRSRSTVWSVRTAARRQRALAFSPTATSVKRDAGSTQPSGPRSGRSAPIPMVDDEARAFLQVSPSRRGSMFVGLARRTFRRGRESSARPDTPPGRDDLYRPTERARRKRALSIGEEPCRLGVRADFDCFDRRVRIRPRRNPSPAFPGSLTVNRRVQPAARTRRGVSRGTTSRSVYEDHRLQSPNLKKSSSSPAPKNPAAARILQARVVQPRMPMAPDSEAETRMLGPSESRRGLGRSGATGPTIRQRHS